MYVNYFVLRWVVNPRTQQVLLQQRSAHKDTYPNCWDVSVAGHITAGDQSVHATVLLESTECVPV